MKVLLKNPGSLTLAATTKSNFLAHIVGFRHAYRGYFIDKFDNIRANSNLGKRE